MVPTLNRTFVWVVTAALFTWSHIFLVMKGDPSAMMGQGRNLVGNDYVQSLSSIRNRIADAEIQTNRLRYLKSKTIPQWMKDYFNWHNEQTRDMNETNFEKNKYLILRCTKNEEKCGGVADRLKSIPFFIAAAARSKRIFMIRWSRPTKLEEFLLPNELNWSVPDWMVDRIENQNVSSHMQPYGSKLIKIYKRDRSTVLESLLQDFHGGSALYYRIQTELDNSSVVDPKELEKQNMAGWSNYEQFFHDLFRSLFEPSPPVAKLVETTMRAGNLTAGNYASCHHRAFYAIEDRKHKRRTQDLRKKAINAVNCASIAMPGAPIYFTSDSQQSIDSVRHLAAKRNRPIITAHQDTKEVLHLDKVKDWESKDPSEFYPTFVDLLLMANGRCTAYGEGGFGRFGALLSYDSSCIIKHNDKHKTDTCRWTDASKPSKAAQFHQATER